MFKSIFIKYILAFLVIITISFTILATIISSNIFQYSREAKNLSMATATKFAKQNIEKSFWGSNYSTFEEFIYECKTTLSAELAEYAELVEASFILVANADGIILLNAPLSSNYYLQKDYISKILMQQILNEQEIQPVQTLDGVFYYNHLINPQRLTSKNGDICGVLLFCSTSVATDSFVNQIINTVILNCLWVLAAAMVIVYFITEKTISPVRAMSRAAKSFELGRFDVRVPVKGRDEVGELAVAFNNMAASLSINDETQRTFLANISHDLRTPMTTIAGFIEGILDGTIPDDQHKYYLNIVFAETNRLARLVKTMFEITRIQSGERTFNKKNFDVCEMARLVLITLEQKIEDKKLDVEFLFDNEKTYVFADADAIHQVLQNLCENAIKFTPENGLIRINIADTGDRDKKILVSVFNTGTGIAAGDIPFLFNRLYKTDRSRGLDKTGVGLGLFIVKTIIDAHEEKIWVNSEYEKNCEFTFTLQKTRAKNQTKDINL